MTDTDWTEGDKLISLWHRECAQSNDRFEDHEVLKVRITEALSAGYDRGWNEALTEAAAIAGDARFAGLWSKHGDTLKEVILALKRENGGAGC